MPEVVLSRGEIVAIVENLFIGNRLEEGGLRVCVGCTADLRRIRNPLVIFASYSDNITPPHQALGWIYASRGTTRQNRSLLWSMALPEWRAIHCWYVALMFCPLMNFSAARF